ncbi:MAG: hypothetical protein WAM85_13895 [Terracidiphilus sp.]
MELFLNSVWALVATVILCYWLRLEERDKAKRRLSFVALTMLIVILFPVISVSDDLWSLHNPAETDTCQRRDHLAPCPHFIFPAVAALPESAPAELAFGSLRLTVPLSPQPLGVENPALDPIQNRPPPAA